MKVLTIQKEYKLVQAIVLAFLFIIFANGKEITNSTEEENKVELIEYSSTKFPDYELYAVYSHENAPLYFLKDKKATRALWQNEEVKITDGIALTDHEFISLLLSSETKSESGITTYTKVVLLKKDKSSIEFYPTIKKIKLTIGNTYAYNDRNTSAKLILQSAVGSTIQFQLNSTTGDPNHFVCEINGVLSHKGNMAYFESKEAKDQNPCKLFVYFSNKKAQVFMASHNTDCGCGMNASPEGVYIQK